MLNKHLFGKRHCNWVLHHPLHNLFNRVWFISLHHLFSWHWDLHGLNDLIRNWNPNTFRDNGVVRNLHWCHHSRITAQSKVTVIRRQ